MGWSKLFRSVVMFPPNPRSFSRCIVGEKEDFSPSDLDGGSLGNYSGAEIGILHRAVPPTAVVLLAAASWGALHAELPVETALPTGQYSYLPYP